MWWWVWLLMLVGCADASDPCAFAHAGPGAQRLALLVGVSKYQDPDQDTLIGPVADVAAIREVLVDQYGFDARTCVLLDEHATVGGFRAAMGALASRADADDEVVLYFAGHGSQLRDRSREEGDNYDETLTFHDSRNGEVCDVRDDELHDLLSGITARGANVTVLLDACHSGASTRGDGAVRYMTPSECGLDGEFDEGAGGLVQQKLRNVVFLSASGEKEDAYERNGRSDFSVALVEALTDRPVGQRFTWAHVRRRVMERFEALGAKQTPELLGRRAWDREVFGDDAGSSTWRVSSVHKDHVVIEGVPGAGWSAGAVVRIYAPDRSVDGRAVPAKADAVLSVTKSDGIRAEAVATEGHDLSGVAIDSRVVLDTPGRVESPLKVKLEPLSRAQGALADPHLRALLDVAPEGPALTIRIADRGFTVLDAEGFQVRQVSDLSPDDVSDELHEVLEAFATQHAIRLLKGRGGDVLKNEHSLKLRLVPAKKQECAAFVWKQQLPGALQETPLCGRWRVEVILREDVPMEALSVGGAILWNDGRLTPLPSRRVERGQDARYRRMSSWLPVGAIEHVLVAGVPLDHPISWEDYDDHLVSARGPSDGMGERLLRTLNGHADEPLFDHAWTTSSVQFRTVLEPGRPRLEPSGPVGDQQCLPTPTSCSSSSQPSRPGE